MQTRRLSDDELRAITDDEMRRAVGFWSGKLADQRRKAMQYYYGEATGDLAPPEVEGRSSVVSPDVRNTIEAMLPQLMVKFAGSEQVVEFRPRKQGDEPKAEQATDYINYLYHTRNDGEMITYGWMKDALLSKVGFLKVWWDTRAEETRSEYRGANDMQLAELMDNENIEILDQRSYPDEDDQKQRAKAIETLAEQAKQIEAKFWQAWKAGQIPPQAQQQTKQQAAQQINAIRAQVEQIKAAPEKLLYDVGCKEVRSKGGRVRVENVPPEEFLISRNAKSIQTAPFVGHRVARTISELRSMGYKNLDDIGGDDQATSMNMERIQRMSFDDELAYLELDQTNGDPSQRMVWVTECYLRVDADGDGIAELRKIVRAGDRLLENEIVDCAPFVSICPVPMPHKFFGLSIADLAIEGQRINTALLRGVLDNTYLQINGRYFAVDGQVNIDDLLTSRPGGIVRIKAPGMAGRLDTAAGDSQLGMSMLEYMKGYQEDSTGWSRLSQGNDPSSLNASETATKTNIVTNKADMRVDLIARNFASGFVRLFELMLKLTCQYQDKPEVVNLRGEWVPINPREWVDGFDMSINVGLGVGNKDQQVAHLNLLGQQQQLGMQVGTATPKNLYETQREMAKALGFKNTDKFFTDPAKQPPKPPPPSPDMIKAQSAQQLKQMELQADAQKFQAEMQARGQEQQMAHQAKLQELQQQYQLQASNDQRDAEREQMKAQYDAEIQRAEQENARTIAALQAETERYKADLDAHVRLTIAGQAAAQAAAQADAEEATAEAGE